MLVSLVLNFVMPVSLATQLSNVVNVKIFSYEPTWLGSDLHLGAERKFWITQIDILNTFIKEQMWNIVMFINTKDKRGNTAKC